MKLDNYPIVPVGSVPTCFSCSGPTDPNSEEESGFTVGRGARQVSCPRCGKTTYFDFAPEVPPANEAHVVAFGDGTFLGQARTRVKTVGEAILYTRSEAVEKAKVYELGTYSIIPLRKFDLDAMRDQAAREAEAGR